MNMKLKFTRHDTVKFIDNSSAIFECKNKEKSNGAFKYFARQGSI